MIVIYARSHFRQGRFRATDKGKIEELFREYGDDVFRLAMSYLRCVPDAEDVCQSEFLTLAEGRVSLFPGKEKSWLLRCTANACRDMLRKRKQSEPLQQDIGFVRPEDQGLWDALARLPGKYRAALHLYYYEGYDQGEIAGILGISRTAVQTRMSRARALLKKELNKYD